MVSVTLSVSEDVKMKMDRFEEMNWSGFVRKAILEKISELDAREELLKAFEEEKDIRKWAVKAQRRWRKERGRSSELLK